jgi:signal peptidase I
MSDRMTKKRTAGSKTPHEEQQAPLSPRKSGWKRRHLRPWPASARSWSLGLFILTFLGQNFVIPSGSMEKTLLVGDHLVVDRITLSPPSKVDAAGSLPRAEARRYRRLHQARADLDADGKPQYLFW